MKRLIEKQVEGCFQEEKGKSGTIHMQGCIKFRSGRKFDVLKKVSPKIHWSALVGRSDWCAMWNYCHKVESRCGEMYEKIRCKSRIYDVIEDKGLLVWQKEILEKLDEQNDRQILWVYEEGGSTGKTKLLKHIRLTQDNSLLVGGSEKDMKYAVAQAKKIKGDWPDVVLVNLTRRKGNKVSYEGLEGIKDGLFFVGKYESCDVVMGCPRILVMANKEPEWGELSEDRWDCYQIVDKKLVKKCKPVYNFGIY